MQPAHVVGLGMVASLGTDVVTNCAAARAGLSRSAPVEHYLIRSEVEGDPEPVIAHQASLYTRGFEGEARLVRLAQGALTDLIARSAAVDWMSGGVRFYMALPSAWRSYEGIDLIPDEEGQRARSTKLAALKEDPASAAQRSDPIRGTRILRKAAVLAQWPTEVAVPTCFAGHAGGLEAVSAALSDLSTNAARVAVVLGIDSLLDEETLDWLNSCQRLKCDGTPTGCQPGEAAAAVALTLETPTRPVPSVRAVSIAHEQRSLLAGGSGTGQALATTIAACAKAVPSETAWVVSDHNGEVYRANDWGYAVVRLRSQFESFAEPVVWYPALSFGDTGAASALAGICVAVRAWERNYAPATTALIAAASEGSGRAALCLESARAQV
jgi:3-oxoacyl-[acyl-carrier-protein] synthase-1